MMTRVMMLEQRVRAVTLQARDALKAAGECGEGAATEARLLRLLAGQLVVLLEDLERARVAEADLFDISLRRAGLRETEVTR